MQVGTGEIAPEPQPFGPGSSGPRALGAQTSWILLEPLLPFFKFRFRDEWGRLSAPRWTLIVRPCTRIIEFGPYDAGSASSFDSVTSDTPLFAAIGSLTICTVQQGCYDVNCTESSSERRLRCLRPEFRTYGDSQVRSPPL